MALDFPSSPVNGQVYDNFIYDSEKGTWKSLSSGASPSILVSPTITSPIINNAVISATATTSSTIPLTVTGAASQSANLQEWKNSAGIALSDIDNLGNIQAPRIGLGGANPSTLPSNINLQVNGRAKILSTGAESAGIWITGSNNVDSAFIGQSSAATTDPIGIYHNGAWRFQVDSSGRVTMPYQPAFSAYASAATLDATRTMPYNVAAVNVGGHYNTSTYRFTAPTSGTYVFSMHDIGFAGYTTRFDLMKNGASQEDAGKAHQLRANNTSDFSVATSFWVMSAAAGDYFEVRIYAGRAHGTVEYSWFSGYLLG